MRVKSFRSSKDREVMAFIMSALAFGQVDQIIQAGERCMELMNNHPRDYIDAFNPQKEMKRWEKYYYRMVRGSDMLRLFCALKIILKRHGTLRAWFLQHVRSDDSYILNGWARAASELKETDQKEWRWDKSGGIGFNHLLPDPDKQGACKRPNLMLRWLIRSDDVDLGLWRDFPSSKLLIPLDTHVHRIALLLGLTKRKDVSLKTVVDITEALKKFDPDDPVKYDFAISRLGILKQCTKRYDPENCKECVLQNKCRYDSIY
jgi:uncharacterized protein (TIGR02757 family)